MEHNGKWLQGILNANGYTPENLASQTGLPLREIEKVIADQNTSEQVWDDILTVVNNYPALDYPAADILDDLKADIEAFGGTDPCVVYYGVNAGNLIFTDYMSASNMARHGADVSIQQLAKLRLTLVEALELFTKQNCTLNA